jgi:hypothetical protein
MSKAQAKAEQFFTRSASHSTKGSRKGFDLLDHGVNPAAVLNADELAQNHKSALVSRLTCLNAELAVLNAEVRKQAQFKKQPFFDALKRRDAVKAAHADILAQIVALNAARQRTTVAGRIERHFVDLCRETMTRAHFNILMDQARERAKREAA